MATYRDFYNRATSNSAGGTNSQFSENEKIGANIESAESNYTGLSNSNQTIQYSLGKIREIIKEIDQYWVSEAEDKTSAMSGLTTAIDQLDGITQSLASLNGAIAAYIENIKQIYG